MRGEFLGVWSATWAEIWTKLGKTPAAPRDLFCELYRDLARTLNPKLDLASIAATVNDPLSARRAFMKVRAREFRGERQLVDFLERVFSILQDTEGSSDPLSNWYFNIVESFIQKYSLRYDLRRPFVLCPTLTGVFSGLIRNLRTLTSADSHLDALMKDFEDALRDLRHDVSGGRIKTCIQKQVNLLEAIGRTFPGVTEGELGGICGQIDTWPHGAVKAALKNLYGFASDYPGIRHSGTQTSALRIVDMRDMVAMSILLAGFTPYLSHGFDPELVYRGA